MATLTEILLGECMLNFIQFSAKCLRGLTFFSGDTVYRLCSNCINSTNRSFFKFQNDNIAIPVITGVVVYQERNAVSRASA